MAPTELNATREAATTRTSRGRVATLSVLFKLRIVALLLFAALGGAMVGSDGAPTWGQLGLLMLTGGLSAAGASALNQYFERQQDGNMKRTRRRPLVTGEYDARRALVVALAMVVLASGAAVAAGNIMLAFFLLLGVFIYVGIYTLWLKPRSITNVVIGGTAGSAAILSGGAAVGNWADPGVIVLAVLLFFWSPIHFWCLALAYRNDYERAGVPMLPVMVTSDRALFWMLSHAVATGLAGLLLGAHGALGWPYLIPVGLATLWLWREAAQLITQYTGQRALRVFKVSNLYLSMVLLSICVVTLL